MSSSNTGLISSIHRSGFASLLILFIFAGGFTVWAEKPSDQKVANAVEDLLDRSAFVADHLIDVNAEDGVVVLKGSVDTLLGKERATEICETVRGVKSVDNRLDVRPMKMSDREVKQNVVSALLFDPATDRFQIKVNVKDGKVTLRGKVTSLGESLLATEIAKGAHGVRSVKNELDYPKTVEREDKAIWGELDALYRHDPWINDSELTFEVNDGKVMLKGSVASAAEKRWAKAKAAVVTGVEDIDAEKLSVNRDLAHKMQKKSKIEDLTDKAIGEALNLALQLNPRTSGFKIHHDVNTGVARLSGIVDNLRAKQVAETIAENTLGVWRVKNRIKVRTKHMVSDAQVSNQVKTAIENSPSMTAGDVKVRARNGLVTLTGTVDNEEKKEQIGQIASRIVGVIDLRNALVVRESLSIESDLALKDDIEDELFWSPFIDSDKITVTVNNRVATLSGTVETWQERVTAEKNAFEAGAKTVENLIDIEGQPGFETFNASTRAEAVQ